MTALLVSYDGINIEYMERENQWRFELRGRERIVASLALAKEAIDKPSKVKAAFKPIAGWMRGSAWSNEPSWNAVTVTSFAEKGWRGEEVWVSKSGKRSKERVASVYAATDENDAIRVEVDGLDKLISDLQEKRESLVASLSPVDISAWKSGVE